MRRKHACLLGVFILVMLLSTHAAFARPSITLFNIAFYLSKGPIGQEINRFRRGETVFIIASPPIGGATVDIEVQLIFPPESGRPPLILLQRTRVALPADKTIANYKISDTDFAGKYAVRVTVWDPTTGRMEQGDLPFEVEEESPIPWWIIVPAVAILAAAGAVLLLQRRSAPVLEPTPPEPSPEGQGQTMVMPSGEHTLVVPAPSGETMRLAAMLELGDKYIPITNLPAKFGREDFKGMVPDDVLRLISRRATRGQFTIDYDYASGSFVIYDEGSTNGTFVNGEDIRGKGRVPLKDGDTISPANSFNLRFTVKAASA
ncbi:MAG: FHA domain-containing protein [Infirmifilum sp.]